MARRDRHSRVHCHPARDVAQEAAALTPFSERTLERAFQATDPHSFPPPLKARKAGTAHNSPLVILIADLEAWLRSLPEA